MNHPSLTLLETARWHLGNQNCKHILLGIGHDSGYAPFLEEIVHDEDSRRCLSLIKGPPLARELDSLQMNVIDFNDIFRATKLVSDKSSQATNAQRTLPIRTQTSSNNGPSTQAAVLTPATSTASLSPNNSWAKVTKSATPPPQLTMPLPPKQNKPKPVSKAPNSTQPAWSPGARGLDPAVTVSLTAMENIKRRAGNEKLCNNHYLRGPCGRIDVCPFVHNYKATQEDLAALAMLSRQNPCTNGQVCDVDDCIYGHNVSPSPNHSSLFHVTDRRSARTLLMGHARDSIADSLGNCIHQTQSLSTRTSTLIDRANYHGVPISL
jgi:hypothetical protein